MMDHRPMRRDRQGRWRQRRRDRQRRRQGRRRGDVPGRHDRRRCDDGKLDDVLRLRWRRALLRKHRQQNRKTRQLQHQGGGAGDGETSGVGFAGEPKICG